MTMMGRHQQQQQQQQPPSAAPNGGSNIANMANITTTRLHHLARCNPQLAHKLRQMALPLSPLVQLTTGAVHAHFPRNVLQFWLLTDDQLESLAVFYHQRTPCSWTTQYPCPIAWRSDLPLEEKRRRMGRFIGLRGCDDAGSPADVAAIMGGLRSEDEIAEDTRLAAAAADDEVWRRKLNPW
ncbi:beta-xylosidase [Drechmeria coniospora]|uniref:Beta-xylosidase n=1 Tax=Drechmeria coniospora TaxID=98403 RepID=A0A151GE93_DRECN|nr:beta-xylosidase [Drechmeria coniospora]KYK55417.1 beta-xylosidase [Drechmeria coniospora]